MEIKIDWDLCESHGQCEYVASEVFTLNDDGDLLVAENVADALRPKVELAARVCPTQAIHVEG